MYGMLSSNKHPIVDTIIEQLQACTLPSSSTKNEKIVALRSKLATQLAAANAPTEMVVCLTELTDYLCERKAIFAKHNLPDQ